MSTQLLPSSVSSIDVFEITTAARLDQHDLRELLSNVISTTTFADLDNNEILVAVADSHDANPQTTGSSIAGALVWRLSDDLTAFVWCPVVDPQFSDHSAAIERELLNELARRTDRSDAWFSQCLLEPTADRERSVLLANGFEHIAHLKSLRWTAASNPDVGLPEDDLISRSYDPVTDRHRMARLIESTWIDSFDCPKLNGRRTAEEAMGPRQTIA